MITLLKKYYPYLLIALMNPVIGFLFQRSNKVIYIPTEVLVFAALCYWASTFIRNKYNLLLARFWISFFFLGVLNINSVIVYDTTFYVNIHDASILYFLNLIVFIIALIGFESKNKTVISIKPGNDFHFNHPVLYFVILAFPVLFIISLYKAVGFLPILSGDNFVDEMYNYDYGALYGFKFICVYSFLLTVYFFKLKKFRLLNIIFAFAILFISSVDGKRFILFICLLAFIPFNDYLKKLLSPKQETSYAPIIVISVAIVVIYISMLAIRLGNNNVDEWLGIFIEKIPFGVEYKDFVYSYEKFSDTTVKDYDFFLSNVGAFFNSGILNFFGFDKEALTHMGSAYVWMNAYNIEFGIRTGIVSELYFAYGIWGILAMVPLAYFINKTALKLTQPSSVFELIQYAILYALYILIINGQATVFFGCLSMMLYVYFFKLLVNGIFKSERFGLHRHPGVQPNQLYYKLPEEPRKSGYP